MTSSALPTAAPRGPWLAACVAAETVGMTAAAGAAVLADAVGPGVGALAVVVAGGLVEGTALGVLQGAVLARWRRHAHLGRAWALVTLAVAGVGWAAASAPAALQDAGPGDQPARAWVLLGAVGLGLVMGLVLGAAQAWALGRGSLPHPWRWVPVSTAAWAVTMPVIFLGATSPAADWPPLAVVATGTATGLVAGAVLGAVSGAGLRRVAGQPRA